MTVATSTLLGRPLWYELMTTDMKGAEAFYRTVVGWKTSPFDGAGQPYTMFNRSGDVPIAGVMTKPNEVKAPPFWAMYVGVPKLEEAAAHIERLGGKAHTEVIDVPDVGRLQMLMDPQGAAFYIYEPAQNAEQRPEGAPDVGEASWHELMTTDAPAAMKFYEEVFGWKPSQAMDMGPMGTYQMFDRPHGMIGGMMNKPPEMANVPSNWQIYFRVPDVHAAAERIKANGGQILNGPMEVPGGDWILNATDPQGAAFGLHARKAG
jgi:predicted enzyme related to lactoylglutathione lyase